MIEVILVSAFTALITQAVINRKVFVFKANQLKERMINHDRQTNDTASEMS